MPAAVIIQLIAQFGIPLARDIYNIVATHFATNQVPTDDMWDKLLALENASHAAFVNALKPNIPPVT